VDSWSTQTGRRDQEDVFEGELYASRWLAFDDDAIARAIADHELREVICEKEGKKA
jgi:hypothetical protein